MAIKTNKTFKEYYSNDPEFREKHYKYLFCIYLVSLNRLTKYKYNLGFGYIS